MKGPILCLVGPPGVGTSLGKSIAKATNRKFIRFSLEVSGRSRNKRSQKNLYRIVAWKNNTDDEKGNQKPLFLLDEIDKVKTIIEATLRQRC